MILSISRKHAARAIPHKNRENFTIFFANSNEQGTITVKGTELELAFILNTEEEMSFEDMKAWIKENIPQENYYLH